MTQYEFRVIPAPKRGQKARGVKGPEAMYALAVQTLMNEMGAEGWDYVRADTLPSEERQGLTGRVTVYHNLLVFRRAITAAAPAVSPARIAMPEETVVPVARPDATVLPLRSPVLAASRDDEALGPATKSEMAAE